MVLQAMADLNIAVIGCGNPNRSDDGVGPAVIAELSRRALAPEISLFDAGTDGMAVMYRARGATHLIVIDARAPQRGPVSEPGSLYDVPGEVLAAVPPHSLNLHDFRWDHAIYTGRQIYREAFPKHLRVLLIEAESLELGLGLTPKVAAVVARAASKIEEMCTTYLETGEISVGDEPAPRPVET
ncbi:MAG: hydrogenase maturation protease [Pseudomonadota bacterium]